MTRRSPNRLPEKYYTRRRAAAVVVIVLVVVLLIWLLTSIGGGSDEAEKKDADTAAAEQTTSISAQTTSAEEDAATPTASASEEPDDEDESPYPDAPETEAPESDDPESDEAEPSTTVDEKRDSCGLSDLVITASSDQTTYPAKAQPTFYMTVANPTAADCDIDLDKEKLRFEVYNLATNERIWSDTDCFEPVESGEQTFESGSERYFEAVWSRRASTPGQCDDRPTADGGNYFLHAVIGTNPSPAHTFNLA